MQISGAVVNHLRTRLLQWFAVWNPEICRSILQSVQNSAARIVTKTAPREHITPVLKELHWLPVDRINEYRNLLYAYKVLAPEYLCNMVESYAPDRALRSASQNLLVVPRESTVS